MLAFMPFRKPLGPFDRRLTKQTEMMWNPAPMGLRSASPVASKWSRGREDPCSFRTRLEDDDNHDSHDTGAQIALDNPYMLDSVLDSEDIKFDDTQCISVGRSLGKFMLQSHNGDQTLDERIARRLGPLLDATPTDILGFQKENDAQFAQNNEQFEPAMTPSIQNGHFILTAVEEHQPGPAVTPLPPTASIIFTPVEEHQDTEMIHKTFSEPALTSITLRDSYPESDDDEMETMNMPFWHLATTQYPPKRHSHHAGDAMIPDDMSIISDTSLIPTYFPSDIMREQQQQRPHSRALIKRIIITKARSAKQTMRQLKRTCRDAVGGVFVDAAAGGHRPTQCVPVGVVAH